MLVGCVTAPLTKLLTQSNNGEAIEVPLGAIIEVELAANPSTGYNWKPTGVTAPILTLIGSAYTPEQTPRGMVGAGGTDTFRFRATKTGKQKLQLNYARPWQTNVPPVETASFTISVRR